MLGVGLPAPGLAAPGLLLGVEGVAVPPPAAPPSLPSSLMHFSRSVPVMPTHLAGTAVAPPEALSLAAGGLLVLPDAAGGLLLAPLDEEPELCASETLAIAKSAAAVAVLTSLNIFPSSVKGIEGVTAALMMQRPCLA
jgi:hypothetical protein